MADNGKNADVVLSIGLDYQQELDKLQKDFKAKGDEFAEYIKNAVSKEDITVALDDSKGIRQIKDDLAGAVKNLKSQLGFFNQLTNVGPDFETTSKRDAKTRLESWEETQSRLVKQLEGYQSKVEELKKSLAEAMSEGAKEGEKSFKKSTDATTDNASNALEVISQKTTAVVSSITEEVDNGADSISKKLKSALSFKGIKRGLQFAVIGAAIIKARLELEMLKRGFAVLKKAATIAIDAIKKGLSTLRSTLLSFGKEGFSNLTKATGETKRNAEMLEASLLQLKNALGSAFAPIFNYITPALNTLISGLASAANAVARFMAALTGKGFATVAKKSFDGIGDSASAAGGAVGELQRQLMGFDQINKLEDNSGGGGGGGGGVNYDNMFDTVAIDESTNKWADYIKSCWERANFMGLGLIVGAKINQALSSIDWKPIHETAKKIGTSVATFLNGAMIATDFKLIGSTIANGLNTALYTADSFLTNFDFNRFGRSLGELIQGGIDTFDWATFGHAIGETVAGSFDFLAGLVEGIDWASLPQKIVDYLGGIDWSHIASSIFEFIGAAVGAFKSLKDSIGKMVWEKISGGLTDAWDYFKGKIEEQGGNVFLGILTGIKDAVVGIYTWIKTKIQNRK